MGTVPDDRPEAAPALLGAADIARLAGVRRPAVSNWRRRFADFPSPVAGTPSHPLFSLADVDRWCREHERPFRADQPELLWQRVRAQVPDLRRTEFLAYLGASLADGAARVGGPETPETWRGLAEEALTCANPQEVFEELCSRLAGGRGRSETDGEIAAWMAELAGVTAGWSVHDPACGFGTLLAAAVGRGAARVSGQDRQRHVVDVAATRLAALAPEGTCVLGDSLRSPAPDGPGVDAVLCDPPSRDREWGHEELVEDPRWVYGVPPRGESELAWVQHCLSRVRDGGRVVVLLSASVASRPGGRRIRASLLRAGALRAVVEVPKGSREATRHVWVLERPAPDHEPGGGILLVGAGADPASSARAWRDFSAGTPADDPRWLVRDLADLLDGEVDLRPSRYLAVSGDGRSPAHYPRLLTDLAQALDQAREMVRGLELVPVRDLPQTTVGALVDSGAVELHRAPIAMGAGSGDVPVLTASDVRAGREATGRCAPVPGLVTLAPGDVVVAETVREAPVLLVTEAGAVLGPRLVLLRAVRDRVDPAFLAGAVDKESVGSVRSSSGRAEVRAVRLPELPLWEQREYVRARERLDQGGRLLETITDLGGRLTELGHRGLREGELRPREWKT